MDKVQLTKLAIDFQNAAASSYAEARMFIDGRDRYIPRVKHHQNWAAYYANEAAKYTKMLQNNC